MPVIGLGTWLSPAGEVRTAVASAIGAGYRHIDAAWIYGNEAEVGAGIADALAASGGSVHRGDIFVTSKLWCTRWGDAASALDETLSRLGLEYLDLYLLHWPYEMKPGATLPPKDKSDVLGFSVAGFTALWRQLESFVASGKVRAIGVSNMSLRKLTAVWPHMRVKAAVNQMEAHPFLTSQPLLDWCHAHGVVFTAYSPLGSPSRPARMVEATDPAPLHDATVAALAAKYGVSPAQVLLRWGVQRGTVVIPKSTNPERIAQNIAIFAAPTVAGGSPSPRFTLDDADMAALSALHNGRRLIKGIPFLAPGQEHYSELWDGDYVLVPGASDDDAAAAAEAQVRDAAAAAAAKVAAGAADAAGGSGAASAAVAASGTTVMV